jgi:hypothetical protein
MGVKFKADKATGIPDLDATYTAIRTGKRQEFRQACSMVVQYKRTTITDTQDFYSLMRHFFLLVGSIGVGATVTFFL